MYDMIATVSRLHPEVDWDTVETASTVDVTAAQVATALVDAGCDPGAVKAYILDETLDD